MENQETIEQVAENYINNDLDLYESLVDGHISYNIGIDLLNNLFINGAKWQQERSYSEDEVLGMLDAYLHFLTIDTDETAEEWFEQFKKKT